MNLLRILTIAGAMVIASGAIQAADIAAGKKQHQQNCLSCHGSEVYTREDRRVQSRKGLSAQVQRCQLSLNLNWFDDEVENTAEYLNREYYHFNK